jgi:tetratricopeptide (TPR) repeat protein
MKDSSSSFDELMREAVAIKSAQMSRFRKKFDSWPQFHQAGLYYADKFTHLRDAPLEVKIEAFNEKKDEGTKLFKEGDHQKALFRYEESLCVFRWVSSKLADWKNKGIEDSDLTIHQEEQSQPVVSSLVTCYLNIALCNLKLDKCQEAVLACDEALALQPANSKALYRKAIALTQPAGSSIDDYRMAVKLLKQGAKYDPGNEIILDKITEYQEFIRVQQAKSKETFHSFFKKSIVQDEPATVDSQAKLREFEK